MQSNGKLTYLAALIAHFICALVGAILAFAQHLETSIGFIAIALALVPAIGHLRMRRQLAATRTLISHEPPVSATTQAQHLQQIEGALESTQSLINSLESAQTRQDQVTNETKAELQELAQHAMAVHREARLARLLNETTRKELSH